MIPLLPRWVLNSKSPSFYDTESATAIEMVAKIHGAMNNLIDDYNKFVDKTNEKIIEFNNSVVKDEELFRVSMRQEFQDFIDIIDLKVVDLTNYMKNNLQETCKGLLDDLSQDAKDALAESMEIRRNVEAKIAEQDASIATFRNILTGAIKDNEKRLDDQDVVIADAVNYMKTNLETTINEAVETMINNGEITMGLAYNTESESLSISARDINYGSDLSLSYDSENEAIFINEN